MQIRSYLEDFLELFFPECCAGCGRTLIRKEDFICIYCRYALPQTNFHRVDDHEAARLFWGLVPFQFVLSYLYFKDMSSVQQIIHHFKFKNKPLLASYFGKEYGRKLIWKNHPVTQADVLIPVPMQPKKLRKRGYNQSEYFALGLAEILEIPLCSTALKRQNGSVSQIGKNRLDRFQNIGNAIEPGYLDGLAGKHIVLVDDVLTTGATLAACAEVLLKADISMISVITFARKG